MSVRLVCDICGKDNENYPEIIFNDGDIVLPVKNYKGEDFNITLKLSIQTKEDQETLDNAKSASIIKSLEDIEKVKELLNSKPVLKNPKPHICTTCTKSSVVDAVQNGHIDPKNDINNEKEIQFVSPDQLLGGLGGLGGLGSLDSLGGLGGLGLGKSRTSSFGNSPKDEINSLIDNIFGEIFKGLDDIDPNKRKFDEDIDPDLDEDKLI